MGIALGEERLENVFLAVNRDAVARVPYPQMQMRRRYFSAQHDFACLGEFTGVAEQIQDDLA